MKKIRVLFSCTGIGVMNRGIESFFREAFDGLKHLENIDCRLIIGAGPDAPGERKITRLSRFSKLAVLIGQATGRTSYAIEQISSVPAIASEIRRFRPHLVFSSEANLFFQLRRLRSVLGVPYQLLFSNGGPCEGPFGWTDFVHQVSPYYRELSVSRGEPAGKHIMVPYGIHVPHGDFYLSRNERSAIRAMLELPVDRKILLSVGWISAGHKRMDYTIKEVAALPPAQRPYLVMLGNISEESAAIRELAETCLGSEGYCIRSVPLPEVELYYQAADFFVLSSLVEGFGRVYLEALTWNLPVIAHHHPVMEYVIGNAGMLADLSQPGKLSSILRTFINGYRQNVKGREYVRRNFDWEVLAPKYEEMFITAAGVKEPKPAAFAAQP